MYSDPCTDRNAEVTMTSISNTMDNLVLLLPVQHIIVAGDFNFVLRDADTNSISRKPRAAAVLNTIINNHDLYDSAGLQSLNPSHTYFCHRKERTSTRYDRFHVSSGILQNSIFRFLPRTGDHAPIALKTTIERSKTSWKCSDTQLSNPVFLEDCMTV